MDKHLKHIILGMWMSLDMLPKTEATIKTIIFELNKIQCIQDLLKKIMRNHNLTELLGDKGVNLFLKFYLYFFVWEYLNCTLLLHFNYTTQCYLL